MPTPAPKVLRFLDHAYLFDQCPDIQQKYDNQYSHLSWAEFISDEDIGLGELLRKWWVKLRKNEQLRLVSQRLTQLFDTRQSLIEAAKAEGLEEAI